MDHWIKIYLVKFKFHISNQTTVVEDPKALIEPATDSLQQSNIYFNGLQ